MRAKGHSAVMSQRIDATDALDDFPTPPIGTRALVEHVLPRLGIPSIEGARIWEPAAGRGIMAEVLREYGAQVFASDVHRYPDERAPLQALGSFIGDGLDVLPSVSEPYDFVITNPPFVKAEAFLDRGLREAACVCLLLRSNWAEGQERYERIFSRRPPICEALFAERLPMVAGGYIWREDNGEKIRVPIEVGGYDPDASSATAYSWFVFMRNAAIECRKIWIPPCSAALARPDDAARFAKKPETALL